MDAYMHKVITDRVGMALEEDLGGVGDVTTNAIKPVSKITSAKIISKGEGVLCGVEVVREVFTQLDDKVVFPICLKDGQEIGVGMVVMEIKGNYSALLKGERTALNFLAHLSGIATVTHQAVMAVKGMGVEILDTRKTTPGLRWLEKYAVRVGGGKNHRFGLFDQYLIKENHIQAAGGITKAVLSARRHLDTVGKSMTWIPKSAHAEALGRPVVIEVEVRNLKEVEEALEGGVDCLLLDNMTNQEIREAVKVIRCCQVGAPDSTSNKKVRVEISGGVTLERLPELAKLGVDAISMGSVTHSAPAHDFSLLLE
jgi:nicotinate-nucleotide pyrophosphorylase (carboxylating)